MISYVSFFDELQKIAEQSPYGRQLLMGEKVEKEHTGTINYVRKQPDAPLRSVTRSIAMDHLEEDPKYYTHLKEMEDRYVKGGKLEKASVYAAEQTGEGGDPMQTSGGTVRG